MDDHRDSKDFAASSGLPWAGRADYLRLVRLYRGRALQEISENTKLLLRQVIEDGLDGLAAERATPTNDKATTNAPSSEALLSDLGAAWLSSEVQSGEIADPRAELDRVRLRIRQLVRSDTPWAQIQPIARQWYALERDAEVAAKIVELAALHGNVGDVSALCMEFADDGFAYFGFIHPKLRAILVLQLWQIGEHDLLKRAIVRNQQALQPTDVERLYILYSYVAANQMEPVFDYFRKYETACVKAVREYGHLVQFDVSQLALAVGAAANEVGFADEARRILLMVEQGSEQHPDAAQLAVQLLAEKQLPAMDSLPQVIFVEQNWRQRLKMLRQAMERLRISDEARRNERGSVNTLLAEPLRLIPKQADAIEEFAALLYEFRDLDEALPYLWVLFKEHALVFQPSDLDRALWRPLTNGTTPKNSRDLFWAAVGMLHEYVNAAVVNEDALWRARDLYSMAQDFAEWQLPLTWSELHRASLGAITKMPHMAEAQRVQMLRQLRIAAEALHVAGSDIEEYLCETQSPSYSVLVKLQHVARAKGDVDLEIKIITKRAMISHLTNTDLDCLWQLAGRMGTHDLCWRVASILMSRKVLAKSMVQSWGISGERRTEYAAVIPGEAELKLAMMGFSQQEQRLVNALLKVGPELPELLAILDTGAKPYKAPAPLAQSFEEDVDKMLTRIDWLPAQKKMYRFSFQGYTTPAQLPAFVQVMPSNTWSFLLVRLAGRLGLNAWNWKLSHLHEQIQDLIPRLATRQDLSRYSLKVARWLRGLSPEQRSAWYDVSVLCTKISDERGVEILVLFLSRLATMIHQSHYQALNSLHTMRAPVNILWSLETWLLSDEYTNYRRAKGSYSRVAVPPNLQQLATIL